MVEKSKRLVLKRAYFDEGFNDSMEQIVSSISKKLPNHVDRVFNPDLFKSHLVASIENGPDGKGCFVRIFEYENGTTGLINLEKSLTDAELEEMPPQRRDNSLGTKSFCISAITTFWPVTLVTVMRCYKTYSDRWEKNPV